MLICKNVIVNGHRTSMRLDEEMWESLREICEKEGMNLHELCSKINSERKEGGLSASVRLFILNYLRHLLHQYKNPSGPLKFT